MSGTVRLAIRIGYLGDGYHGSQIQPDVKTVQGELQNAFISRGWFDPDDANQHLLFGSRTDAGVHVRVNGGIVTLQRSLWQAVGERKMIRAIQDRLPDDIAILNLCEVEDDWNPRLANHRTYRYRLEGIEGWSCDTEQEIEQFKQHLQLFVGTYDARNFARLEEGKNPMRTILSCSPWVVGGRVVGFEICGQAFLWRQVRRTANALFRLHLGEITEAQIRQAISEPLIPADFGVAPAEWLVLWNVEWPNLSPFVDQQRQHHFSKPPSLQQGVERTMRLRWETSAKYEIKSMLTNEWAYLGKLDMPFNPGNATTQQVAE